MFTYTYSYMYVYVDLQCIRICIYKYGTCFVISSEC
jgi:hypothetical protein